MKKLFIAAAVAALAATGCVDTTTTLSLNRDGSGQIIETTYLSAQTSAMLAGFIATGLNAAEVAAGEVAAAEGTDAEAAVAEATAGGKINLNPLMDEAMALAKATQLGEGVSLVSLEEISKPDGSKGARATYKFTDINKLKVDAGAKDMGKPAGMGGAETGVAGAPEPVAKQKAPLTFSYTDGKLTINLPWDDQAGTAATETATAPETPSPEQAMAEQMMQGMLPMFKGMRMCLRVKVADEIKNTNAKFVGTDAKTKKKQYVTLLDFNMDKLLEAEGGIATLVKLQGIEDQTQALSLLSDVTGTRVEPSKTVTIEF